MKRSSAPRSTRIRERAQQSCPALPNTAPGAAAASLLAESWGPAWRLAARVGLPAYGPLALPGSWTFE